MDDEVHAIKHKRRKQAVFRESTGDSTALDAAEEIRRHHAETTRPITEAEISLARVEEGMRLVEAKLRSQDMMERQRIILSPRQLTIDDLCLVLRNRDKTGNSNSQPHTAAEPGNIAESTKKVPPVLPAENAFAVQGKVWTLTFAGITASCRDRLGLKYIVILLRGPGCLIRADVLRNLAAGQGAGSPMAEEVGESESAGLFFERTNQIRMGKNQRRYRGTILDDDAMREYRLRLKKLHNDRCAAEKWSDFRKLEAINSEFDQIEQCLKKAQNNRGKSREFPAEVEKARKSISRAIRAALQEIKPIHPQLYAHLVASIIYGAFLSYRPSTSVIWTT